jgi:hypothetical protein
MAENSLAGKLTVIRSSALTVVSPVPYTLTASSAAAATDTGTVLDEESACIGQVSRSPGFEPQTLLSSSQRVNDVRLLAAALAEWFENGSSAGLDRYSETALRRVWRAQDFSNYLTQLLHDTGEGPFARRLQLARLEYLDRSEAAARSFAENYTGLPATEDY